jgi:hypothetical protein
MNIYMTALYNLGKDYPDYKKCHQLSTESVFRFLKFDQYILLSGKNCSPFQMLRDTYHGIMKEVRKGNNVFFMEIDCVMVKPVEVFHFDKMELFARTSPWSIKYKGVVYDPYMNSGVKYFPGTLPTDLIDKADDLINNHYDESFWGYDQIVYNMIYFAQHERAIMREELNYMPFMDILTHIKEEDARIIHLFTTRGPKAAFNRMSICYEWLAR